MDVDVNVNRISRIRLEEKTYHDTCYEKHKLFEPGSWLHKPVRSVMELAERFDQTGALRILDLGCGVGRNSIPLAAYFRESRSTVVCVDLLESAVEKLQLYGEQHGVQERIEAHLCDIEHFAIGRAEYDFIVAVSALEHVSSEKALEQKLAEIADGTKSGGIVCLIIGSNVHEVDVVSGKALDPMFEVNLPTDMLLGLLDAAFAGWSVHKRTIVPQAYEIDRGGRPVHLTTDCVTYVAGRRVP